MSVEMFCVYQILNDGFREQVRQWVNAEEAVKAATHYSTCVTAKMGITTEVLIVDAGDCTVYHWRYGEGVVWPKPA